MWFLVFENYTYEELLAAMLSEVPTDVDKREGSIIFDTLSPAALELAKAYMGMDSVLNNAFAETAIREYLIKIAKERGLTPETATNAVLKGEFNFISNDGKYIGEVVSEGNRFNLDKINYIITSQISNESGQVITVTDSNGNTIAVANGERIPGLWQVKCETAGAEGNKHFGSMTPIETISGLTKAELTDLLIPGKDEEDTEVFRQRYFDSINNDAFGGNKADYVKWVKAIDGVGQVKVNRTPNGGGTVGVIITNTENDTASDTLVAEVKKILDPEEYTGLGEGIAPIGHSVTVESVKYSGWDVYFYDVEYEDGLTIADVNNIFQKVLNEYADELNSEWEESGDRKIYAMQLAAKCISADGIINIGSCDIDGDAYRTLLSTRMIRFYPNTEE